MNEAIEEAPAYTDEQGNKVYVSTTDKGYSITQVGPAVDFTLPRPQAPDIVLLTEIRDLLRELVKK